MGNYLTYLQAQPAQDLELPGLERINTLFSESAELQAQPIEPVVEEQQMSEETNKEPEEESNNVNAGELENEQNRQNGESINQQEGERGQNREANNTV